MRRTSVAMQAAMALMVLWTGQSLAQESVPPPDYSLMTEQDLARAFMESLDDNGWLNQPCTLGVPVTAELVRRSPETLLLRGQELALMHCAIEQQRFEQAGGHYRALTNLGAALPPRLGLMLAVNAEDAPFAMALMRRMLDEGGEELTQITVMQFAQIVNMIRDGGQGDELDIFVRDLLESPVYARLDSPYRSSVAFNVVRTLGDGSDTALLEKALEEVNSPTALITMLGDREFAPIWPQLEEHAGDALTRVSTQNRAVVAAHLAEMPDDSERFSALARAMHSNGDFEDAIALAREWRTRNGTLAEIEEGDAWALNIEAYALDSLGREEEADAVFDQLAALDPASHPWLVNFVINRASRLVAHGRWEAGLAAGLLARTVTEAQGTIYAHLLVAQANACALGALGRESEAMSELTYLRDNSETDAAVPAQALLCLGLADEAAAMLTGALADEETRASVLAELQPAGYELFYTHSVLPPLRTLMDSHPALREAFDQYARIIPERFKPRASIRRDEISASLGR